MLRQLQSDGYSSVLNDAAGDAFVCGSAEAMLARVLSQFLNDATLRRRRILRRRTAIPFWSQSCGENQVQTRDGLVIL
jgi:hypothetical protein